MHNRGFTLPELLTVLAVIGILASSAPSFGALLYKQRVYDSATLLTSSLRYARTYAVMQQTGVTVRAINDDWAQGWQVFTDRNRNALLDTGETKLQLSSLDNDILAVGNQPVANYVHFAMSGETEQANGSFQAGTVHFCSIAHPDTHYKVILGKSGRARLEEVNGEKSCQ